MTGGTRPEFGRVRQLRNHFVDRVLSHFPERGPLPASDEGDAGVGVDADEVVAGHGRVWRGVWVTREWAPSSPSRFDVAASDL